MLHGGRHLMEQSAGKSSPTLRKGCGIPTIVRGYADQYDKANQGPAELLSDRVSGFYSRWSIKFSAEYYEARERQEGKSAARA